MKDIKSVIDENLNDFLMNITEKIDKTTKRKKLKSILKEYQVEKELVNMYLHIQKLLFNRFYDRDLINKRNKNNLLNSLFCDMVLCRIYQLENEILYCFKYKLFHSVYGLIRQLTEILITLCYVNSVNSQYINILMGKVKGKHRPNYYTFLGEIEEKSQEKDFVNRLRLDWEFFSGMFHPTKKSFEQSIWFVEPDKEGKLTTKFYFDSNKNPNGVIISHRNKLPITEKEIQFLINRFYVYTNISLTELLKIHKKSIT